MSLVLRFPPRLQNQALKCLAVANICQTQLEEHKGESYPKLSLLLGQDVEIFGSGAICKYLLDQDSSQDVVFQSVTLQWICFVDSELSSYPSGSKQMAKSLGFLEEKLSGNSFLSSKNFTAVDILVGFPLLCLPPQIYSTYPKLSTWLASVKEQTKEISDKLVTAVKSSEQGEKPAGKNKKEGKGGKGKTEIEKKAALRKLRILCIHGYRQNAKTFREKLGSFRKLVGKHAELEFVTAPNAIPSDNPDEQDQYGWWFSKDDQSFDAHENSTCELGFGESVQVVEEALKKGVGGEKYDGVLAFSQGASLAAHLCLLQQNGNLGSNFKFCILVAGFVSRTMKHRELFQAMQQSGQAITIPTLHVFGDTDKVIEKDMSEDMLQFFASPDIIRHPGGHFVPATGEHKRGFPTFLEKMQKLYC